MVTATYPRTRLERIGDLSEALKRRILVLDGAMGNMIQRYDLTEDDFRGERLKDISGS